MWCTDASTATGIVRLEWYGWIAVCTLHHKQDLGSHFVPSAIDRAPSPLFVRSLSFFGAQSFLWMVRVRLGWSPCREGTKGQELLPGQSRTTRTLTTTTRYRCEEWPPLNHVPILQTLPTTARPSPWNRTTDLDRFFFCVFHYHRRFDPCSCRPTGKLCLPP